MAETPAADERLTGVLARLDVALLLDEAGVDVRAFAAQELDELSRTLVWRRPVPAPPNEE